MSSAWTVAFVVLSVVVVAVVLVVLGTLRRILPVLEAAEDAIAMSMRRTAGGLAVGSRVPEFVVTDSEGAEVTDDEFRSNGTHVVLFIGARCPACATLVADLEAGTAPTFEVPVIVVSDSREQSQRLRPSVGLRIIETGTDRLGRALQNDRTPHAFVIDEEGRIAAVGSPNGWRELASLLEEAEGGGVQRSTTPAAPVLAH